MAKRLAEMMAAANRAVPRIDAARAQELLSQGAVALDVRDGMEVRASGKVPGALHVPRGVLEFHCDADSPMYLPDLKPDVPVVVYCASGGRAALAGLTLSEMGFAEVYNLGGLKDWAEAGLPVEPA